MKAKLSLFIVMMFTLALVCLLFASCGNTREESAVNDQAPAAQETTEEPRAEEKEEATQDTAEQDAEKKNKKDKKEKKAEKKEPEEKEQKESAQEDQKAEEAKQSGQTAAKAASDNKAKTTSSESSKSKTKKTAKASKKAKKSSSGNSSSNSGKSNTKKTKKVWVDPVYETRTVDTGLGTTYCNGANSGGGCGASWHGTKEATYQSWKAHWQAYVKRRTAEEAAKGKTYVCDHIHDDCRWVPDPPQQEQVLVKKGYWKTVTE